MEEKSSIIFFLCGKTGGPFFPYKALSKILNKNNQIIYLGVKNSFEEKIAKDLNLKIHFLPETKLSILSFKKQKFSEFSKSIWELILLSVKLILAILKSLFLIIKYKPRAIFTTGSFLNIPLILSVNFFNFFTTKKVKVIVHQQDPLPGIANRFASKFANYLTCTFNYTKKKFPNFKTAKKIPNPIILEDYKLNSAQNLDKLKNLDKSLYTFFKEKSQKPTLMVFGGGTGSLDINNWVINNFDELLQNFNLLHLTGILQTPKIESLHHKNYFSRKKLDLQMQPSMALSDLILCRAGIGSATELVILNKKAFLVPLPHSHQELNAEILSDKFIILTQDKMTSWLDTIKQESNKPIKFKTNLEEMDSQLQDYYQDIKNLLV
jgi:UDP-N-acetylglucosamine--N-acetylmuramyl-(pentapeptide) pyrophosphoryl-undecaprenol N-acetylglucosamine transferase